MTLPFDGDVDALLTAWALTLTHQQGPEVLPDVAAVAVANGLDTPSLVDLAGRSKTDVSADLRELMEQSMDELGFPLNVGAAYLWVLYKCCQQALASPHDAAAKISRSVYSIDQRKITADFPSFPMDLIEQLGVLWIAVDDDVPDLGDYRTRFESAARKVIDVVPTMIFTPGTINEPTIPTPS